MSIELACTFTSRNLSANSIAATTLSLEPSLELSMFHENSEGKKASNNQKKAAKIIVTNIFILHRFVSED